VKVVGYIRVSTEDQADSGAGLEAQRAAIHEQCRRRSWELLAIHSDTASARSLAARPGLTKALAAVESGAAGTLVVAKLDRLSRSLMDFSGLMERSRKKGWALVALDLGVDTTTPSGEMMANVLAVFAQFERRLIGQRTREALAVKRSQGVRLGRRPVLPESTVRIIQNARSRGRTLAAIAAMLERRMIPTGHGGRRWYVSTIEAVLKRRSHPGRHRRESTLEET
jgi:DNA invertase Pin-like site-specific DNA recombinase